jgi:hypothetical protein
MFHHALDECVEETGVIMTWMSILTRRAIIEHIVAFLKTLTDGFVTSPSTLAKPTVQHASQ